MKESTLHSGLCDTADQFITRAFRADFNTATEKKVSELEHKNALREASALQQNITITKKDKNEKPGRFHHFTVKVHLLKV